MISFGEFVVCFFGLLVGLVWFGVVSWLFGVFCCFFLAGGVVFCCLCCLLVPAGCKQVFSKKKRRTQ